MSIKNYKPIAITEKFYQLGTNSFPAYLSIGNDVMLIEGGTGATAAIIIEQVKELGIEPERIKYLALTHTHTDHIGAIPYLKTIWPNLKIVSNAVGQKLLNRLMEKERALDEFIRMDRSIAEIMLSRGEIDGMPPEPEKYDFGVDDVVEEGDTIDLGAGIGWKIYDAPGHSPCHIALQDEAEGILVIGDATGFYDPDKDKFWPNYFESLENYCNSIRKLAALPSRKLALSHNGVIEGELINHFRKAITATESYHLGMLEMLEKGTEPDEIALERAEWVTTFTALVPFEVIKALTGLTLRFSQAEADKENLFDAP